ncbi:MAG: Ig-like domain-containing protein [Candidatus Zixiibacteriota bacterium]
MTVGLSLWADVPGHKPDREVRVESFKPQGTTDPAVNISIKFSNSLVPPDSLKCPTGMIPVQITPDIAGFVRWTATNMHTIYPSRPLKPATEYKATVRAGSGFVNGNAIRRDQDFSFRIPPFSIEVSRIERSTAESIN